MTSEERSLILASVQRLQPDADRMAAVFFERLFAAAPNCRHLFAATSLEGQFLRLLHVLTEIAALHERPEGLVRTAAELGRRHVEYGVTDAHYQAVEEALLAVIDRAPAACPTPEVRRTWRETYELVSGIMRRAATRAVSSGAVPGNST
jgi:hemoglobin-like flavoprotein